MVIVMSESDEWGEIDSDSDDWGRVIVRVMILPDSRSRKTELSTHILGHLAVGGGGDVDHWRAGGGGGVGARGTEAGGAGTGGMKGAGAPGHQSLEPLDQQGGVEGVEDQPDRPDQPLPDVVMAVGQAVRELEQRTHPHGHLVGEVGAGETEEA